MNRIRFGRTTRRPHCPDVVAMPANAWRSILELGRLAPTPHNTQWYRVRVVDGRTAHVCIDESIAIPFTDPNDQFRYTGLGVSPGTSRPPHAPSGSSCTRRLTTSTRPVRWWHASSGDDRRMRRSPCFFARARRVGWPTAMTR